MTTTSVGPAAITCLYVNTCRYFDASGGEAAFCSYPVRKETFEALVFVSVVYFCLF